MVALILNAHEVTTEGIPCCITDFWGKEWSFLIPFHNPASKISPRGKCFLECYFLSEHLHENGKAIRVIKTDHPSVDGNQLFEVSYDDVWGDHSHNDGTEVLHPISPRLFTDIGIDSDTVRDIYLKLRILPRFLTINCECGPMKVSSLAMHVECPRCGFGDKIRHLGAGNEVQDILEIAAMWLGLKDRNLIDSLKLHADDEGAPVDWGHWDTYFKVTQKELHTLTIAHTDDRND